MARVPGGPTTAFAAPECQRPFPRITAEAERVEATPGCGSAPQVTAGLAAGTGTS